MALLSALLLCIASVPAWGVPESQLAELYDTVVLPHYDAGVGGQFTGVDGVPIVYRKWEVRDEKAAIVFVSGRTETFFTDAELFYDLNQLGFSVYTYDHRGQGYSGRLLEDPMVGYVREFDDYTRDLKTFMDAIVKARPSATKTRRLFIMAHSMGGAIATRYVLQNPGAVDGMVLLAPMFRFNTGPVAPFKLYSMATWHCARGRCEDYAFGQFPYSELDFERNVKTHSEIRYRIYQEGLRKHPELIVGGASNRWALEALDETNELRPLYSRVSTPTLLFQAGKDLFVRNNWQDRFCERARNCRRVVHPKAFHRQHMETDEFRDEVLVESTRFFLQ